MTKELEALERIKKERTLWIDKSNKVQTIEQIAFADVALLEKALTPPTSDEVCEAIEKWLRLIPGYENIVAKFDKKINWYFSFDLDKYGRVPVASFISNVPNEVNFHKEVPLELAYLIIRFFKDFADSLEAK